MNIVILIICILGIPYIANADFISVGDPVEGGSWSQRFNESGVGNFDLLEIFIVDGNTDFEAPGFLNFNKTGWQGKSLTPHYAKAWGTLQTSMDFDIKFTDPSSSSFKFDFLAWQGDQLKEAAHASWSGSAWTFTVFTSSCDNSIYSRAAVPLPGALLLLGAGLVRLTAYARRRKTVM